MNMRAREIAVSEEHETASFASVMDDLDRIIYRASERLERMKEAYSFSMELFVIDVRADGAELEVGVRGLSDVGGE